MRLVETPVTDPDAQLLLTHYFAHRATDFPAQLGTYAVKFPDPTQFVPPIGVFLVARDDAQEPLGCGGIRSLPAADRHRLARGNAGADAQLLAQGDADADAAGAVYEVKHVWLEPGARGQGWAGILMRELEARALAFGADTVVLDTNSSLTDAARLYARLGYEGIEPYNDNPNATNWYRKSLA